MKNSQSGIIVPVLLIIIVLTTIGGGFYVYTQKKISSQTQTVPIETLSYIPALVGEVSATSTVGEDEIECAENSRYFVVTLRDPKNVGASTIIKYKTQSRNKFLCEYKLEQGDYEIKDSWYLNGLVGDSVIFDSGTTVNRGIEIYDLRIRKQVYSAGSHSAAQIVGETLKYWDVQDGEIDASDCSAEENKSIKEDNTSWDHMKLERRIVLDLKTLTDVGNGETRCGYND